MDSDRIRLLSNSNLDAAAAVMAPATRAPFGETRVRRLIYRYVLFTRRWRFVLLVFWAAAAAAAGVFVEDFLNNTSFKMDVPKGTSVERAQQRLNAAFPSQALTTPIDIYAVVTPDDVWAALEAQRDADGVPIFVSDTQSEPQATAVVAATVRVQDIPAVAAFVVATDLDVMDFTFPADTVSSGACTKTTKDASSLWSSSATEASTGNDLSGAVVIDSSPASPAPALANAERAALLAAKSALDHNRENLHATLPNSTEAPTAGGFPATAFVTPVNYYELVALGANATAGSLLAFANTTRLYWVSAIVDPVTKSRGTAPVRITIAENGMMMPLTLSCDYTDKAIVQPYGKTVAGRVNKVAAAILHNATWYEGYNASVTRLVEHDVGFDNIHPPVAVPLSLVESVVQGGLRDAVRLGMSTGSMGMSVMMPIMVAETTGQLSHIDSIVLPLAFIILTITLRSLRLLILPVFSVGLTILLTFSMLYVVVIKGFGKMINSSVPALMMTLSISMGIDYNLFLLSRYIEEIRAGNEGVIAIANVLASAGHTVAVSGVTLAASFLALAFMPTDFLQSVGIASGSTVLMALVLALGLTPTLLLTFPNFFREAAFLHELPAWAPGFFARPIFGFSPLAASDARRTSAGANAQTVEEENVAHAYTSEPQSPQRHQRRIASAYETYDESGFVSESGAEEDGDQYEGSRSRGTVKRAGVARHQRNQQQQQQAAASSLSDDQPPGGGAPYAGHVVVVPLPADQERQERQARFKRRHYFYDGAVVHEPSSPNRRSLDGGGEWTPAGPPQTSGLFRHGSEIYADPVFSAATALTRDSIAAGVLDHGPDGRRDPVAASLVIPKAHAALLQSSVFSVLRPLLLFPFNLIVVVAIMGCCGWMGYYALDRIRLTSAERDFLPRATPVRDELVQIENVFGRGIDAPFNVLVSLVDPTTEVSSSSASLGNRTPAATIADSDIISSIFDPRVLFLSQYVLRQMLISVPTLRITDFAAATGGIFFRTNRTAVRATTDDSTLATSALPASMVIPVGFDDIARCLNTTTTSKNNSGLEAANCDVDLLLALSSGAVVNYPAGYNFTRDENGIIDGATSSAAYRDAPHPKATIATFYDMNENVAGVNCIPVYHSIQRAADAVPSWSATATDAESVLVRQLFPTPDSLAAARSQIQVTLTGVAVLQTGTIVAIYGTFPIIAGVAAGVILLTVGISFRSFVVPLRCLVSIACTQGFVFGLSVWTFQERALAWTTAHMVDAQTGNFSEGLSWLNPLIVFCVLVGVALDYDIFLLTRVQEFVLEDGVNTRDATLLALCATGKIITAAGGIMAVAFFGLMVTGVQLLNELGFMLVAAALFDTFIVRTLLVPALLSLLGRWHWFPSAASKPPREGLRDLTKIIGERKKRARQQMQKNQINQGGGFFSRLREKLSRGGGAPDEQEGQEHQADHQHTGAASDAATIGGINNTSYLGPAGRGGNVRRVDLGY
jgi:predicted RND superfamily exporter protein